MNSRTAWFGVVMAIVLSCGSVRAAADHAPGPANNDDVLAPFIDDNTFLVIQIDASAIDVVAHVVAGFGDGHVEIVGSDELKKRLQP